MSRDASGSFCSRRDALSAIGSAGAIVAAPPGVLHPASGEQDALGSLKRVRAAVLDYPEFGAAEGTPMLLLHGFPYPSQ